MFKLAFFVFSNWHTCIEIIMWFTLCRLFLPVHFLFSAEKVELWFPKFSSSSSSIFMILPHLHVLKSLRHLLTFPLSNFHPLFLHSFRSCLKCLNPESSFSYIRPRHFLLQPVDCHIFFNCFTVTPQCSYFPLHVHFLTDLLPAKLSVFCECCSAVLLWLVVVVAIEITLWLHLNTLRSKPFENPSTV